MQSFRTWPFLSPALVPNFPSDLKNFSSSNIFTQSINQSLHWAIGDFESYWGIGSFNMSQPKPDGDGILPGENAVIKERQFLPLALDGERLCREGEFGAAVAVFRAALDVGTTDSALLSAVYIQLGNAYFHLEKYDEALDFHTRDLHIARYLPLNQVYR